ncbi:amidoligase family protein [Desmospora activa]|uniref:Putative amidoligase enzyme n=1 Tax=Desmospora activa DSM 45169 TaxID=1121389 RepID=A0A2T4ZD66_9BACL|nr:amidoligase family protein [Desmospora activa]PTM59829.1 putative amidoligase enzyme [Desmospora activa DSM 45169]
MKPIQTDWQHLRFGVEIEFVGGTPERLERLPGWTMSLDERQTDDSGEESGSELKPPPLQWKDREQIRVMLARLQAQKAIANWSCGLHVHVSLEPWGKEAILQLIEAALRYQEAVKQLLQTSADRLIYCPPVTRELLERYQSDPTEAALCHKGRPQSHRCGINLAAWFWNKTVEIRYANGSLDYNEVINTVEFCLRFVAAIGTGRKLPCDPQAMASELGAPISGYPRPLPAPRWYRERMWLEEAFVPVLAPLASSLVQGGEILHIRPDADGILVVIEDAKGKPHPYRLQLPSTGWDATRLRSNDHSIV